MPFIRCLCVLLIDRSHKQNVNVVHRKASDGATSWWKNSFGIISWLIGLLGSWHMALECVPTCRASLLLSNCMQKDNSKSFNCCLHQFILSSENWVPLEAKRKDEQEEEKTISATEANVLLTTAVFSRNCLLINLLITAALTRFSSGTLDVPHFNGS